MSIHRRELLLDVGEQLFGSKVFLTTAISARHAGRFFQSQFGCDAGAGIRRLEAIGMIKRTKKRKDDHGYGTVWYEVTKHPYWRLITMVEAGLVGMEEERKEARKRSKKEKAAAELAERREQALAEITSIEAELRS